LLRQHALRLCDEPFEGEARICVAGPPRPMAITSAGADAAARVAISGASAASGYAATESLKSCAIFATGLAQSVMFKKSLMKCQFRLLPKP
ncbi:MAG TPA: hypothetical protein VEH77_17940, partial [Roseiarcus sp.]|nr:hypothetical protein [Roseiarcus sp.]